jgi:hypothetical protein
VRGSSELVASGRRPAHHRSARRRPAWFLFFLLLPDPHSPRPCRIAPAHARTACVLGRVTSCLHRPCTCACASAPPAPGSALRATARSGPLASARAPLLRLLTPPRAWGRPAPAHAASFRTPAHCCLLSPRAPGLARPRPEPLAPRAVHAPAPPTRPPLQRPLAPRASRTPALRRLPRPPPTPAPLARSASARPRARARPSAPPLARAHALALAPHVQQLRCLDSRQPE